MNLLEYLKVFLNYSDNIYIDSFVGAIFVVSPPHLSYVV